MGDKKFRIREQYGIFFIEEYVKKSKPIYKRGWFETILLRTEYYYIWIPLFDLSNNDGMCACAKYLSFKTKEEALSYIEKLEPIYHYV
jgi:hypothetical protein